MKRNITALLTAMALLMSCSTLPVLAEEISDAPLTDEPLPATVAEPLPPMEEEFRQDGLIITIYTPYGYGTKYAAISGVEQNAESVTIPASFQDIPIRDIVTGALCSTSLKEILVAEDQQYYTSKDGVLFDAEGSTLKVYPLGKTGTYSVPEGTETLGTYAFSAPDDYKGLTEVTLPESLRTIAPHAFLNQCGLTELVLPDGCKSVGEYAFAGCQGLTSLHLGKQLNSFFKSCTGCTSLQELTGDPYNFNIIDNVLFSKDNRLVLYPAGLTAEHYTMPDNVLGIREGAFENNPYLKEIDIPGTTVSVQETFCHMTALETLNFPEGVGSIGNVGVDCPALKSVRFPSTLTFVGASAFRDSKALTDIYYNGRAEQYEKISNVLTNRHIHCDRVTVHYNDEDEYELFFDGDEENGGFTYKLYEDHAVLAGFTRTKKTALNETVRPLAEVKGLPVTVVGRRAFENAVNYGGIELPDSIRI